MKNNKTKNYIVAKNVKELSNALGLELASDIALIEYKAELSQMAVLAIEKSGLTVNEVVKRSGVARSKVSAIKNGSLAGISCDLFMKVISASGARLTFKMAS
ncbi:MAG: XRE family transcriptional regulator [Bacteriovorax sp.]|jgi:predicted XRE-type DNA-binding protein